ncbi:MAG: exosortase/archaeosortase family protein [Paludibacteraceae bacterium]|nr:exosortase/archaeosortase family protein [Paludibacteraceae bacterium]
MAPYRDVIIFMVTLLVANYFWKFTMVGDENGDSVTWFGMDITAPFEFMACHIASVVYWIVSLFRDTAVMTDPHTIHFTTGTGTTIIWGCTAIKQSFIWLCLMLTVVPYNSGRTWLRKLWFIPVGWLCCYAFNILRIAAIALFIEHHPEWFHLLHDYIFKYLFYAMLFGLWVLFVEKIRPISE